MLACRTVAFSFTAALLAASLPAAAEPPPAATVVVVTPSPTAPLPVAPLPQASPPAGRPQAPAPYYGPPQAPYYAPPPGGYYAAPYAEAERTERQSSVAMALGIVGLIVGGVSLVTGTAVVTTSCDDNNCGEHGGLAAGLIVVGVVGIAAGIPLTVYGTKRVPLGTATSSASPLAIFPAWAGAPAARGWQWRF